MSNFTQEQESPKYIHFIKTHPDAVTPTRANETDIGLDLVAINIKKELDNKVILYDTGIQATPPKGYYLEIVPRSSISKTGWMLANSIGTIDPTYTGNLLIALMPICENVQKIELPFCKCQLILRKAEYAEMKQVLSLEETGRGDGGFGSTGERV